VYVVLSHKAFFGYIFFNFSCRLFQGFFRRMAKEREAEKYQCNKAGDCEINMITRNLCKACRYRACLRAGMCVEGTKPMVICYFLGIKNVESYLYLLKKNLQFKCLQIIDKSIPFKIQFYTHCFSICQFWQMLTCDINAD